jgi:hypothetical protein
LTAYSHDQTGLIQHDQPDTQSPTVWVEASGFLTIAGHRPSNLSQLLPSNPFSAHGNVLASEQLLLLDKITGFLSLAEIEWIRYFWANDLGVL